MKSGAGLAAAAILLCAPRFSHAEIREDLSYVDKKSAAFDRFEAWVESALKGSPGYEFSASDAATYARLVGKDKEKASCEFAVKLVDEQVSKAEAAIASGSAPEVAGNSYLYVGPAISDLALTYDWCAAHISPQQRQRWAAYADETLENVWNPRGAKWGTVAVPWSGWSIDNPGNNYHYSFLAATMYWALASNNARWLAFLRDDKLPKLEAYLAKLPGGGSLEGTGYGTSFVELFALYTVWRDSTGVDLANANRHLSDTIAYWVHATVPTLDQFAPIGDQARVSLPEIYDYQRCLMLEARYLTNDAHAREIASWWLANIALRRMSNGSNDRCDLLSSVDRKGSAKKPAPAELWYHASGAGHLFARTGWTSDAMWLDFVAGPYNESHAHQDQGSFTLFEGGWLAVTENVWTHSGIQQGTETNNVVRFERNGTMIGQLYSTSQMSLTGNDPARADVRAEADLSPAYAHGSGVKRWKRGIEFGEKTLTVHDTFSIAEGVRAIFQINVPAKPAIDGRDAQAGKLRIKVLKPADARLSALEWSSRDAEEFRSGWRIDVEGSGDEFVVEMSTARKK